MNKAKMALLGLFLTVAQVASATPATFDSTTFETTLTDGVAAAAGVAAAIAALYAGVLAWKKVAKYFNKAG